MSLLNSSITFTRYKIDQQKFPESIKGFFSKNVSDLLEKIKKYQFKEIEENSDEEMSYGWVSITDDEINEVIDFYKSDFIVLNLRIDTRKVPSQAIKYLLKKEIKNRTKNGQKVTKNEKGELKEAIRLMLLKRAIPATKICSMVLNTQNGDIIFESTSDKICNLFTGIFNNTFDVNIDRIFPFSIAKSLGFNELAETNFLTNMDFPLVNDSDNMVQMLESKSFIGKEFLTWLWYIGIRESIPNFQFNDKITLQYDDDTITCCGEGIQEIKKSILEGKKVTKANFYIEGNDIDYSFALDNMWMNFKSCKLPKIERTLEDLDGKIFERIYFINSLTSKIDTLFSKFLKLKNSINWRSFINILINYAK